MYTAGVWGAFFLVSLLVAFPGVGPGTKVVFVKVEKNSFPLPHHKFDSKLYSQYDLSSLMK